MAKQSNFQKFVREVYRFVNTAIERLKKADRRFLMMVGIAIVIVIVLIVLICVGVSSGKDDNADAAAKTDNSYIVDEPSTDAEPAVDTLLPSGAGNYVVATGSTADLNMRPTAGTQYSPIVAIPNGTSVQVLFVDDSSSPSWGYIEYNGERGWVSMDYLKAE